MKKLLSLALFSVILISTAVHAQNDKKPEDKSKRPSPPATASVTTSNGLKVSIDYSQPSIKGRTVGKDVEPMQGKVWRTGANEATVFEISKDAKIEGKDLKAGKYGLYSIWNGDKWTIILNKTWDQWGTKYAEADDALRIDVPNTPPASPSEKLGFTASSTGDAAKISLAWGNVGFAFNVQ